MSTPYDPAPRRRIVFHVRENLERAAFTAVVGALIAAATTGAINAGVLDHDADNGMHRIVVTVTASE